MSVKVFTAEESLAAVKAGPSKVLTVEKKKEDKAYKGTKFLNAYYTVGADSKKEGWFSAENIVLTNGVADPANKDDRRNEFEGTRLQLETTVSKAGPIGEFLLRLDPEWRSTVAKLAAEGAINTNGRKVHGLVQTNLSENNEKNPNGIIEDPIVRFKVDFDPFPAKYKHKFLIGQPRSQFFDYSTRYIDEAGKEQFKPATVKSDDGKTDEPVTEKNLHKFVTANSIIRKCRIMMPSVSVSGSWVSLPITINRVVLEQGSDDGFSDDVAPAPAATNANLANFLAPASEAKPAATETATPAPAATETATPAVVEPPAAAAATDDLTNMLESL